MAWLPRSIARRSVLLVPCLVSLFGGCLMHGDFRDCPEGQALTDGQCVPTSSIVFQRCIDSFRKSTEHTAEGSDTQFSANVSSYGGKLRHARTDQHDSSYAALPDEVVPEAIAECRRQEEAEREQQVQRAWAAADLARERADQAGRKFQEARRETEKVTAMLAEAQSAREAAIEERDDLGEALLQLQARFDEQAAVLVDKAPLHRGRLGSLWPSRRSRPSVAVTTTALTSSIVCRVKAKTPRPAATGA